MEILFKKAQNELTFDPLFSYQENIGKFPVGRFSLEEEQIFRINFSLKDISKNIKTIRLKENFWPSLSLLEKISHSDANIDVRDAKGDLLLECIREDSSNVEIIVDTESVVIKHLWDMLKVNEELICSLKTNNIAGTLKNAVNIEGILYLGSGSILLPGVYIEGNVVVGSNCKIGPNCYIRGNTRIGNNCHIGQAVEIKNSIIMDKVSIGHLSYVGDSIIGSNTNFGAGTITANLRHDGCNHKSMISGELIDTQRRKLGVLTGEHVHTGIHTSIYPGRKLYSNTMTLPGEIINKDKTI